MERKLKYSDLVSQWLNELGYTHCFYVAGGGIMHLLDGVRKNFVCIPVVHEVTAGISAEHFNECSIEGSRAFALVTTGPGLTNILTAVAGCYVEHRPLLVIAGQVKSTDMLTFPERQRGVQEIAGTSICKPITVRSECLRKPIDKSHFTSLVRLAHEPHPGPVVIEICLDVQGAQVDYDKLHSDESEVISTSIAVSKEDTEKILQLAKNALRPIILLGGLVSRVMAWEALPYFEKLGLPVATTTSAIDRIHSGSPVFAGRPGTWGGQRAANLIIAQADLVIAVGAQLDLQQTGFNYAEYAPQANLVHVFPSNAELRRVGPLAFLKVLATPDLFLDTVLRRICWVDHYGWGDYVREVRATLPSIELANTCKEEYVSSFRFLANLSKATAPTDILALCSSGGTFTGALQNYELGCRQIATTSAAHASMGYGLATAIGAAFANQGRRVVLTEGEGGFCQNLQELAIIKRYSLPIKIFIIDNQGYASIRATQKKFFGGHYLGCDPKTGLGFPDWIKLFNAYDIPCRFLEQGECETGMLQAVLEHRTGPEAWIVRVDPDQTNWPSVATSLSIDGTLKSRPLYDMLPRLSDETLSIVGRYLPRPLN